MISTDIPARRVRLPGDNCRCEVATILRHVAFDAIAPAANEHADLRTRMRPTEHALIGMTERWQATRSDLRSAKAVAPRPARRAMAATCVNCRTCLGRPRSRWAISVSAGPGCERCLPDRWETHLPMSARLCLPAGDRDGACGVLGEGHHPFKATFPRPIRAPGALVDHKRPVQSGIQQRPPEP